MNGTFEIPEKDPLADLSKKGIIDQVLDANREKSGALMVVLNELQGQIGFISETMQQPQLIRPIQNP